MWQIHHVSAHDRLVGEDLKEKDYRIAPSQLTRNYMDSCDSRDVCWVSASEESKVFAECDDFVQVQDVCLECRVGSKIRRGDQVIEVRISKLPHVDGVIVNRAVSRYIVSV